MHDSMVIYVHFITRVVKRLQAKKFKIHTDVREYAGIQYAIILDPSGIEVRLVECTEPQLNDANSESNIKASAHMMESNLTPLKWFARLGYYATETFSGSNTVSFYEALFSNQRKSDAHQVASNGTQGSSSGDDATTDIFDVNKFLQEKLKNTGLAANNAKPPKASATSTDSTSPTAAIIVC